MWLNSLRVVDMCLVGGSGVYCVVSVCVCGLFGGNVSVICCVSGLRVFVLFV